MPQIFVTGTDTDVGKTFISQGILMAATQAGLRCAGYKPVSAGCEMTPDGLRNEDALILQKYSNVNLTYQQVNPIAFADPVAPHLAARKQSTSIGIEQIESGFKELEQTDADFVLVEGAGGWRLPINDQQYLSDFVVNQQLPVVLVVGLKLGCLNHALLTVEAVTNDGLNVVGWVANQVDPGMLYLEDNIAELKRLISAPCLGVVPRLNDAEKVVEYLDVSKLLSAQ